MSLTDNRLQQIIDLWGGGFSVRELGDERAKLNPEAVEHLVRFRNWHGYSTYLTPEGKWRASGSHSIGAFDQILYKGWKRTQPKPMHLWRLTTTYPWWGIGIYFDVEAFERPAIMLHTDIVQPGKRDRPLRWLRTFGRYYYQSPKNGKFYTKGGDETTLQAEIENWKNRNQ